MSKDEERKWRNLYISLGFISFIGMGVVTQLVDFYANKAIEAKLDASMESIESARIFVNLQSLATKLDLSDSFTHMDRTTVMSLLVSAQDNESIRKDPGFVNLLEKIVDSFVQSGNALQVDQVFDMYELECLQFPAISTSLLQHYGMNYISAVDSDSAIAKDIFKRLQKVLQSLSGSQHRGASLLFTALSEYKRAGLEKKPMISQLVQEVKALDDGEADDFLTFLHALTDWRSMGKRETPELARISVVARKFLEDYGNELDQARRS